MTDYFRVQKKLDGGAQANPKAEIVTAAELREIGLNKIEAFQALAADILTLDEAVSILLANDPLLRTDIANREIRVAMAAAKTDIVTTALLAWTFDVELGLCETCGMLTCWHEELPGVWLCRADYLAENPAPEAVIN